MLYYVKNESGNVSDVTEEIYEYLKTQKGYECWKEEPFVPQQVEQVRDKSTDYTVAEVRERVKDMNDQELAAFIKGDERKTVKDLA